MKNALLVPCIISLTIMAGCEQIDIEPNVPKCLINRAEQLNKSTPCDKGASVKEYIFQDKTVYVLIPGNCMNDGNFEVIDADCNQIGILGGLAGTSKVDGVDFYDNAIHTRTVWED